MIKILDRYIALELFKPFLLVTSGFLLVMLPALIFPLTDLIVKAGASLQSVGKLLLYNIPFLLVMSLPVGFMAATLLVIGRLTKDFEIIAMRSAGVSLKRLILPILLLSGVVSAAAFALNEGIVPFANKQINLTVQDMTKNLARPPIKENTFFQGTDNRYFYVKEIGKDGVMKDVFIFDKTKDGLPQVIQAEQARWIGNVWRLEFGNNYKYDRAGYIAHEVAFKTMDIQLTLNAASLIPPGMLNAQEMSSQQLAGQLSDLRKTGGPSHQLEVQLYKKWALPLASLCAALIAAPLGLIFSRMGGYVGVAFSIILIFVYYVTLQITEQAGNFGAIPPFLGAWTANLLFFGIGSVLVWRMDLR